MCSVCFTGFRCRTRASASFFLLPFFPFFPNFFSPLTFFFFSLCGVSSLPQKFAFLICLNLYLLSGCLNPNIYIINVTMHTQSMPQLDMFKYTNWPAGHLLQGGPTVCVWERERVRLTCCRGYLLLLFCFVCLFSGGAGLWLTCCRGHLLWVFFGGGVVGGGGGDSDSPAVEAICCCFVFLGGAVGWGDSDSPAVEATCCRGRVQIAAEGRGRVKCFLAHLLKWVVQYGLAVGLRRHHGKKGSSVGGSRCTQRPSLRGAGQRQVKGWRGATRETLFVKALQQRGKHCRTCFTHTAFTSWIKMVLRCKARTRYCEV